MNRRPKEARMRADLPYGVWTCADGRAVLFNRGYRPIWQRRPGQAGTLADAAEWVPFVRQAWFYTDRDPPWRSAASRRRCEAVLAEWSARR
jgi:hypothetical protein